MRVYKRDHSAFWQYEFMVNGKRYRASTKRKTKADATRVMNAEYQAILDQQQFGQKPEITLKEAMEATVNSVSGSTQRSYDLSMRKCLGNMTDKKERWSLDGSRKLSSLSDEDLEAHVLNRRQEGLTNNSINVEIRFLKRMVNFNKKKFAAPSDLDFNLCEGFAKSRVISEEEESRILEHCLEQEEIYGGGAWQKAHDLFIYLLDTGVRLSEALEVEWADIDLQRKEIDNWNQKTKKSVFVPVSDRLCSVLSRRMELSQPFPSMDKAVKNLRAALNLHCVSSRRMLEEKGKATLHSCRDTYATRMLNSGMSLDEVSHLLCHASVTQTQKYAKFSKRAVAQKARDKLNAP